MCVLQKLEADSKSFKTAKTRMEQAANDAGKIQTRLLGDGFFSRFKTELYATAQELFSSETENKSVNKVLKKRESAPVEDFEPTESGESSLMVVEQPHTTWEKIAERLQEAPIIQGILGQARKVQHEDTFVII